VSVTTAANAGSDDPDPGDDHRPGRGGGQLPCRATISYGTWFWWIGGITLASLAVAALLYLVGRVSGPAEPSVPAGAGGPGLAAGADG
jgi:hypothetical protein